MLNSLISNKSAEKILFYLLLNSRCYATQLSQRLETPLTPLQHALQKLEEGGVLLSHSEGKTRHFEFNPNYPLLHELESLLKKAYTYLPVQQKKLFYSPQFSNSPHKHRSSHAGPLTSQTVIFSLWQKLREIKTMSFCAKSKSVSPSGWNGIGKGQVEVKSQDEKTLVFHERGSWNSEENKRFDFSNIFRWILKAEDGVITLEHLRFGAQNPVFLFSLVPIDAHTLESLDAHICNQDSYFGQIRCDKHFVQFNWRSIGPKKNEEIDYLYT